MGRLYKQCAERFKEIRALSSAAELLAWDQETMMPEKATGARAEQQAAMAGAVHGKITDPKLGELIKNLDSGAEDLTGDEKICVREWLRDHEKAVKLPEDLVRELARTASHAQEVWAEARKKSRFEIFSPWLKKMVALKRREADALGYKGVPYDALLDVYEPKATVAELDPVISEVRKGLVPIVAAIKESNVKIDTGCLKKNYPEKEQEEFLRELMPILGVDMKACRMDRSVHPFCCGMAPTDVRITTRYDKHRMTGSLYGMIHESGHAMYEQGFSEKHIWTPLAEFVSLGIHESQSRLWENVIGRGRPFVSFLLPQLKRKYPEQLKKVGAGTFYRAINVVEPSFIRTEADEVTYSLHVILRYEIETAIMAGDVKVDELPSLWNEKMKKYLGLKPASDAQGVLQDVHWSAGLIGYFPTYLLGNLYAAQWWTKIGKDIKNRDEKIARGELSPILKWLRKNIHEEGQRYSASDLVLKVTGERLKADNYLNYLKNKFGEIYDIKW